MYTKRENLLNGRWIIVAPNNGAICEVDYEYQANSLLIHLNR